MKPRHQTFFVEQNAEGTKFTISYGLRSFKMFVSAFGAGDNIATGGSASAAGVGAGVGPGGVGPGGAEPGVPLPEQFRSAQSAEKSAISGGITSPTNPWRRENFHF